MSCNFGVGQDGTWLVGKKKKKIMIIIRIKEVINVQGEA
jgi:hypothetical protein